jgi:hypothetical protein
MGFEEFLEYAMQSQKDGARGHFSKSRVGVPIRDGSDEDSGLISSDETYILSLQSIEML